MSILDNAKEVAKAVQEINNLELYKRVLSLHSDIIALVEENNMLRDQNKEFAQTIALKKSMVHRPPFFYQDGDPTPFCPGCWEGNLKAVHLMFGHDQENLTSWNCPNCKQTFLDRRNKRAPSSGSYGPSGPDSWMR